MKSVRVGSFGNELLLLNLGHNSLITSPAYQSLDSWNLFTPLAWALNEPFIFFSFLISGLSPAKSFHCLLYPIL